MEKLFTKKKCKKLVVFEGYWGVGKTRLIQSILNTNNSGVFFIPEPNHLNDKIIKNKSIDISTWYRIQHEKRMKEALVKLHKSNVIMERSFLSNIAFEYAINGKLSKWSVDTLLDFNKIKNLLIIFVFTNKKFLFKKSKNISDTYVRKFAQQKYFLKRYMYFFKKLLPKYIKHTKLLSIKINKRDNYTKIRKALNKIFYLMNKNPVREICVAGVLFFKDKILALYDFNYKHFVFPQGHVKKGEALKEALVREIKEETGFINIKIIKKIKTYDYKYIKRDIVIHKIIHVYLVYILNNKKISKSLEIHEKYTNKFFSYKEAIKRLNWEQDKHIVLLAKKYFKKQPSN